MEPVERSRRALMACAATAGTFGAAVLVTRAIPQPVVSPSASDLPVVAPATPQALTQLEGDHARLLVEQARLNQDVLAAQASVRAAQARAAQVRAAQVRAAQVRATRARATQARATQVAAPAVRSAPAPAPRGVLTPAPVVHATTGASGAVGGGQSGDSEGGSDD